MADNNFRASRGREPLAKAAPVTRGLASDPLAELARLIGQSDPVGEYGRGGRQVQSFADSPPAAAGFNGGVDDGYAQPSNHLKSRNAQPAYADPYPSDRAYQPQDGDYEYERPEADQYPAQPASFDDGRDGAYEARYRDEPQPAVPARQLPALAPQSEAAVYQTGEQWLDEEGAEAYAAEEYDEAASGGVRRTGMIVVSAVIGLAVFGTAGVFAYRTMFGGAMLPSLPPIIKASEGPNKIVPSHSEAQADTAGQSTAAKGAGEKLVSREEQPLHVEAPPNAAPRVVSTIPILPAPGAAQGAPPPAVPTAPAPVAVAPALPPPAAVPPAPAPVAAPPAATAPAPAAASTEPKKVHTVLIRPDQSGAPVAAGAAPTSIAPPGQQASAPATRSVSPRPAVAPAPRPVAAPTPQAGANSPLSIVPQPGAAAAAPAPAQPRARVARAEAPEAPSATAPAAPAATASHGSYAVQVTSQHSEEEAQASFRSLQAKYPGELGGHPPIIRRADLGDKGTYYRALVGPFASTEAAANMCSKLKAAGGSCLVQKD